MWLTLKAPITTAADGIHKYFFHCFSEKIRLDVSSESSGRQRIHLKHQALFSSKDISKLENCVCETQVMPPCGKPVLTPCPILTHDPQHIQSILETNVWNVKVKIAVILSKIIICVQKEHKHIFNMFLIAVQSFKMNAWKPERARGVDYTILLPLTET